MITEEERKRVLEILLIRKDHVLCTRCYKIEPIHAGDGIPASAFLLAIAMMVQRHLHCGALR